MRSDLLHALMSYLEPNQNWIFEADTVIADIWESNNDMSADTHLLNINTYFLYGILKFHY